MPVFEDTQIMEIRNENYKADAVVFENSLNINQKKAYKNIMTALTKENSNKLFFIDEPGENGKSYLNNVLIDIFSNHGVKVLPIAWTGIAAILLIGGKTAHSALRLPLNLNKTSTSGITKNSSYAKTTAPLRIRGGFVP